MSEGGAREAGRALPRLRHLPLLKAANTFELKSIIVSNAVQELQPEESLSKAAQYYNADLAKIDLQYQQSRKKGGKEDEPLAGEEN